MPTPRRPSHVRVIYDGACPMCRGYTRLLALQKKGVEVELIDARQRPDIVSALAAQGVSLDEGFVVETDSNRFHGADALRELSALSAGRSPAHRFNNLIFGNRWAAATLYPVLRAGRNTLLKVLGIDRINTRN